ncbi:MAG: S9 family peptidase [Bacteroidales bacterium]|nr:S9 family peptidase [Bacteroidales bacterium]
MYKILIILILSFNLILCQAQESIIIEKTKINWKDYPDLFSNNDRSEFTEEYHFLANVDMYKITYLSDGLKIESYAAIPRKKGKYPVIIFNRGGNRDFYALQLFKEKAKYSVVYNFSKLANEGYVVIGCNYRGCGKSEGKDEVGGKDINDVINLIDVVKEIPEADENRIGMYGWSRGGMMTYLALTKTDQIKAVVVIGAPSDKTIIVRPKIEKRVYAKLIPNYWNNKEEELKNRSAIFWVDKFPKNVPILMLHGNADWRVKSTNSLKLALEFEKRRIPYRLKIFEGADHGITEFKEDVNKEIISWFDRFLKQNEQIPDMEFHGR